MKRAISILIIAFLGLAALMFHELLYAGYDILDNFHVVAVVQEPGTSKYAVIHDYEHADSSSRVTAIWIKAGEELPSIGSTEPVIGAPVVAWRGPPDRKTVSWANGRLVVQPPAVAVLRRRASGVAQRHQQLPLSGFGRFGGPAGGHRNPVDR